jgi:hypothetical protein
MNFLRPPNFGQLRKQFIKENPGERLLLTEGSLEGHYLFGYVQGAKSSSPEPPVNYALGHTTEIREVRIKGWKDGYGDYHE